MEFLTKKLSATDVKEAIALYQSLSLLSYLEQLKLYAAKGIGSNITLFNAIA